MTRYRKTMAQAMNEGAIQMQIATLKKAYEPMRNKRISLDNANKLSQIFNRFDSNKEMLKQLYKADIPFVSAMATSRLISKHNMKAQELMQIRKEGIETSTDELKQINEHFLSEGVGHISGFRNDKEKANMISLAKQHGLKIDDSGSKLKLSGNMRKILDMQLAAQKNGLKAEEVRLSLDEGRMSQIDQMQKDGKSAAEIAKLMKLDVKTVKSILGEEEKLHEFKKMTVTIADPMKRNKAMQDIEKQGFKIQRLGSRGFKVDGNGADLNKYAIDLKNFYKADIRAESYTIDESADEDFYNPVTEACWTGYKQVGMKDKGGKQVPNCVPESVNEQEEDTAKLKNQLDQKDNEIAQLKQKAETDKAKNLQQKAQANVNPETGEPLLQVGIAYKHLKDKMEKEAEKAKQKENSQKIKDLATGKKGLEESNASDKAKSMGLDYMKFGRYGKDGKVTHKTSGDNLVKVGKDDEPTDDKPAKKPDAPKKDTGGDKEVDTKIKSKNFLRDLDKGKIETKDGDTVELDFDDEGSFEIAAEKAREMGLDDLADDIDDVGGYVMEMEPDKAQAAMQDLTAKYSGKPVKALELSKKADEAISMMSDQTYAYDPAPFASDLMSTMSIVKKMVDSDETEGNPGSGMSNSSKGFRPEVIDTLQQLDMVSDHAAQLEDEYDGDDEKVTEILGDLQGEINFITDENADHDNYTKPYMVNSVVNTIIDMSKELQKRLSKEKEKTPSKVKVPSAKEMKKDLEGMVTDGMIDVEFDGSEIDMAKEYEASQDYDAEKDAKAIRKYFKKKGVSLKKDDIEIEKFDDYISLTVNKKINETFTQKILEQMKKPKKVDISPEHDAVEKKESADYLKSKMSSSQLANIKNVWKHKTKKDVTPAVKKMIKDMDVPTQLAIKHAGINLLSDLVEMAKDDAYAIGMSQAKKKYNDEPPLDKKTITKGHEIAKSILKKEETIVEFTSQQIKQAYGIANDPRYKQGNYSGAVAAIEKLAKGLSKHPDVQKVLKRTNENAEHPAKEVFEQIKGLKNKAEKSGMPYSILKKVYDRGMAAWRGGHRPGASQQQWAFARVNSFITKSSGTWGGADKDLAAKVKGK